MTKPDRPTPASYWVEPDRFLAGEYPGAHDEAQARNRITAFLNAGFDTFFDLTHEGERPPYLPILYEEAGYYGREIHYQHFPIPDCAIPSRETMTAVLDAIDTALTHGRKVYLHCVGGIGRTGTTVGCYLVRHGRSGEQALSELAERYRSAAQSAVYSHSPENKEQAEFIRNWKE